MTSQWFDLNHFGLIAHPIQEGFSEFDASYVMGDFERQFSAMENLPEVGWVKSCGTFGWFHPSADPRVDWTPFLTPVLAPNGRTGNFSGESRWMVAQVGIDTANLKGSAGLFARNHKGPHLLEFGWNDRNGLNRAIELMSANDIDELRTLRALVSPDDVKRWGWTARISEQRKIAYRGANRRRTRFPLLAVDRVFTAARKKVWPEDNLQAWGKPWSVANTVDHDDKDRRTLAMEIMFSHSYATSHEERASQRNFYTQLTQMLPDGVKLLRATKTAGKSHILLLSNERLVHENWAALSIQGDMLSRLIGQTFSDRFPESPEWHRWDATHQRWRRYRIPS